MMSEHTIDEVIDLALSLMERDVSGEAGVLSAWIMDNLVYVLDEYRAGQASTCEVQGYDVLRIGGQIAVATVKAKLLDADGARRLACALLRAAEAADMEI